LPALGREIGLMLALRLTTVALFRVRSFSTQIGPRRRLVSPAYGAGVCASRSLRGVAVQWRREESGFALRRLSQGGHPASSPGGLWFARRDGVRVGGDRGMWL